MLCCYGDDMEEYRRWEDNIKMDLKEIGVDVMSWLRMEITTVEPLSSVCMGERLNELQETSRST